VLAVCRDLSSSSDEPFLRSTTERQRAQFHPARANLVRTLNSDSGSNVLEISPGYGSITRYLGEICGLVDAIEPEAALAQVVRARTADLARVEVFVGTLQDVPAEPFYDLIVADGVLTGTGRAGIASSVELVRSAAMRLAPGGLLALGVDNNLGIGRLFRNPPADRDRLRVPTGTLDNAPASFCRAEIVDIFQRAGMDVQLLGCFPDHRVMSFVFDPELLPAAAPELVARGPIRSGDASGGPAAGGARGRTLAWQTAVNGGLSAELANSFLVLASRTVGHARWENDLAGIFFSVGRRSEFTCRTRIEVSGDKVMLRRDRTAERPQSGNFRVEPHDTDFVAGTRLLDLLIDTDDERSVQYLGQWAELVRSRPSRQVPFDLIPQNLIVGPDGGLCVVDDEWRAFDQTAPKVLARGVLLLGQALAERGRPAGQWRGCQTFREVVTKVGAVVGLDQRGLWIESAVAEEARFQAAVNLTPLSADAEIRAAERLYSFLTTDVQAEPVPPDQQMRSRAVESARLRAETLHAAELAATAGELVLTAETRAANLLQQVHTAEQKLETCRTELLASRHNGQSAQADLQSVRAELRAGEERWLTGRQELARIVEVLNARSSDSEWALAEVARMRGSVSWRVTTPLRWVRRRTVPRRPRPLPATDRPASS
jgi:SAM-dependent methyltransferase